MLDFAPIAPNRIIFLVTVASRWYIKKRPAATPNFIEVGLYAGEFCSLEHPVDVLNPSTTQIVYTLLLLLQT